MPGADLLGLKRAWVDAGRGKPRPYKGLGRSWRLARPFVPLGKL